MALNPDYKATYEVDDVAIEGEATNVKRDESPTQQFNRYTYDFKGTAIVKKRDYLWPTWYEKNIEGIYKPKLLLEESTLNISVSGSFDLSNENTDIAEEITKLVGHAPPPSNGNLPLTWGSLRIVGKDSDDFDVCTRRGGHEQPYEVHAGGKGYGCSLSYDAQVTLAEGL